jgi:hypothetical protein
MLECSVSPHTRITSCENLSVSDDLYLSNFNGRKTFISKFKNILLNTDMLFAD